MVVNAEGKGLATTRSGGRQEEDRKGTTVEVSKRKRRCQNRGGFVTAGLAPTKPGYGRYYRSALYSPMRQLDRDLTLWAAQKYKKLRRHLRRASHWLARIRKRTPALFAHWQLSTRHGSMMGAV